MLDLLQGMGVVGDLFGAGKMFLPQVCSMKTTLNQCLWQNLTDLDKHQKLLTFGSHI